MNDSLGTNGMQGWGAGARAVWGTWRIVVEHAFLTYLIGVWPDQEGSRHTNGPCIALRLERW